MLVTRTAVVNHAVLFAATSRQNHSCNHHISVKITVAKFSAKEACPSFKFNYFDP